jgi:hypothetical protein
MASPDWRIFATHVSVGGGLRNSTKVDSLIITGLYASPISVLAPLLSPAPSSTRVDRKHRTQRLDNTYIRKTTYAKTKNMQSSKTSKVEVT